MSTNAEESSQSRRRAALLAATTARLEGHSRPAPTTQQGGGTSSANRQWTPPSAEDDRKKKLDFARICTRDIMGANNYAAAASCISTLLKISHNVVDHPEEAKYSRIKASNTLMKTQILNMKGGQEYLIALGFRSKTLEFVQHYIIEPFPIRPGVLHNLRLGVEVLDANLPEAINRVTNAAASAKLREAHDSDVARRAEALAQIEADREKVKERTDRERLVRDARAAMEQNRVHGELDEEQPPPAYS